MIKDSNSCIQMCLKLEGMDDLYLRIPTYWDAVQNQWIGFIKTPKTKRVIAANAKNSFELQNAFNIAMSKIMHESKEMGKEIFEMFKPLSYWEKNE